MRCFLAIELPAPIRNQLAELQQRLSEPLRVAAVLPARAVRWTKPEQIHLTIKFLGEVPDQDIPTICNVAKEIATQFPPFDLEISGTGCFPPHGPPRIIWAGVREYRRGAMGEWQGEKRELGMSLVPRPSSLAPSLLKCQQASEATFADQGYPPEQRPYRPHLTIGRVADHIAPGMPGRIRSAIREQEHFTAGPFTVEELVLFQSIQDRTGTTHIPITRAPLRTPDASRGPLQP